MEKIDDTLKALLEQGKETGYLTYGQVNDYLPENAVNPEKLNQLLVLLEDQGIELIDETEAEEREGGAGGLDDEAQADLSMQEMRKDKIDRVLKTLSYSEREIIKLRYGLSDGYRYTLKEVGRIFEMTPGRAWGIEARAVRKLQHPVRSRELEGFRDTLAAENPTTPEGCLLQRVIGVSPARRTPSLFDFATSERCQDALISWLIAWAHHDHREANGPLHRTGVFFLNRLLGLHRIVPPDKYTDLRILKYRGIDILVIVNRDIVVLIEDKIDFTEHSGQLERYLAIVQNDFEGGTPVPVYLKTGDQRDYEAIKEAGWKCFQRRDMLEVLEYGKKQGVESDIFRDFHSRLRQKDGVSLRKRCRRPC